jgi:hypothetical protein
MWKSLIAAALLIIGWLTPALAAVGVDTANCKPNLNDDYIPGTSSPQSTGNVYTVTAGFPGMLVMLMTDITTLATPPTITSVVWDAAGANQALTLIGSNISGGAVGFGIYLYGAVGITAGATKAITVTSSANVAKLFLNMCTFSGALNATVAATFTNFTTGAAATTVNVTSATGNIVAGGIATGGGINPMTGTTIFLDNVNGTTINAAANYDNGAATVTIGTTVAPITVLAYVNVVASGGAPTPAPRMQLLGVGP